MDRDNTKLKQNDTPITIKEIFHFKTSDIEILEIKGQGVAETK